MDNKNNVHDFTEPHDEFVGPDSTDEYYDHLDEFDHGVKGSKQATLIDGEIANFDEREKLEDIKNDIPF